MTTKITITQLRSMIKEAITDLPGGEKDDEKVPFPSAADKQTAIDHQRDASWEEDDEDPAIFDKFVQAFERMAKHQGFSLEQMQDFLKRNVKMIKSDLSPSRRTDPMEYASYLIHSAMNLNKASGVNWF